MLQRFTTSTRVLLVVALTCLVMTPGLVAPSAATAAPLLLFGSIGSEVADWQRQLNTTRDDDIAVDGIFGPITASATREFQRQAGITVDGIVGPETRGAMQGTDGGSASDRVLSKGDRGSAVRDLQARLQSLNYWVGPVDGIYGPLTRQAVMAFQKVNGLSRDGIARPKTRAAMDRPRSPRTRSSSGLVMEVNESRQILMSVNNGQVNHIWNTSTGTEDYYTYNGRRYLADTPNGKWRIFRQIDGWRQSHLGRLWRPKYFHEDGIAIHGYPHVPAQPVSHGCVRVSIPAMNYLWRELPVGTPVWVY